MLPTEDEIAELPVNFKATPGSYQVLYSNFGGRVKSFNDFSSGRKNTDDFMRLLIKNAVPLKDYTDKIVLEALNTISGSNNQKFYDEYLTGAKRLPIIETLAASNLLAKETPLEVFDQGFTPASGKIERGAINEISARQSRAVSKERRLT